MKRSEAIDLILSKLHNLELGTDDSIIEESEFELARVGHATDILDFLEELGMEPPAVREPCETFVLYNGQYIKTEDSFTYTRRWDEE